MMLRGFQRRPALRSTHRRGLSVESCGQIRHEWSIPVSTDILLFSEVGLSLTQHYRVYRGGLPHAVFRTDYIERLRSLLQSSGQSGSPPETGRGSTPKSVRRLHRSSQPRRLLSEAVDEGPFLTVQNPADMFGETVFDCRPSMLPVSIPLSGLSHDTVAEAMESRSFRPSEETGKSIMDVDTNEITINRIVGFEWDGPVTDLEDEMPTPVLSPVQIVAPVIPPAGTADPFGRGDSFDLDRSDVSMIPSMISLLEESEVPPPSRAAEYAAPATPVFETVLESPGYTVPEESGFTWIPGFVPVSETVLEEEGGYMLSLEEPPPLPVPTSAATPAVISVITEPVIPMMPPTPDDKRNESSTGSVRQTNRAKVFVVEATEGSTSSAICQDAQDIGPDLTRE